ncbi:MAG: hypothetical protein M3O15_09535 [Acidobacteriota bacterium]|nr:hypothetical protein [Acidobacteriota bacterium]
MRKTSVCVLSSLLLIFVAAFAFAAPAATNGSAPAASSGMASDTTTTTTKMKHHHAASGMHHAKGTVASVDATAKTITVHPKTGADWTFKTDDKTSYWMGSKKGTWDDVKTGSTVSVTYKADGTDKVATSVKVKA